MVYLISKLTIFSSLFMMVIHNVSSQCNYYVQSDLVSLFLGLVPGPYVMDECNTLTFNGTTTSFAYSCKNSSTAISIQYATDDCTGTSMETTIPDGITFECSGSTSDCDDTFIVTATIYVEDDCETELYSGTVNVDGSGDYCWMLTAFGFEQGYSTVEITDSEYVITTYSTDADDCTGDANVTIITPTSCDIGVAFSIESGTDTDSSSSSDTTSSPVDATETTLMIIDNGTTSNPATNTSDDNNTSSAANLFKAQCLLLLIIIPFSVISNLLLF